MDLYWKICFTGIIIGAILVIFLALAQLFENEILENIFGVLVTIFFIGGFVMGFARVIFVVLQMLWTS